MIRDLYRHMEWSDAAVWTVVLDTPSCRGDEPLRERLYHVHVVQRAFFHVWNGLPMEFPEEGSFDSLTELASWGRDNHREIGPFIDRTGADRFDEVVELPWAERLAAQFGTPAPTTLRDTLLQVAMHSLYHRGQVNLRIRELEGEPPLVDYIAWLWYGRPDPAWPV